MYSNQISPKNQPDFNQIILKELSEIKTLLEYSNINTTKGYLKANNEFLRPKEVCSMFGISRTKFDTLKRSGIFPFKKIGRDVVVLRSDLEKFFSTPKTNF
ncbi:helix-turn-helix transcriptional regulator [Emticicia sp. SJ17W-69]|uniref:helix-turn-helix transcriptional regulator n=1 Tax=Emticicia sp. SJ17W-69 TaxID=3421657 RepID=UPI003EBBE8DA